MSINVFTRAPHFFPLNSMHVPKYLLKIYFNIILPSKPRSSYWSLFSRFHHSYAHHLGKRLESKLENWQGDVNLGNVELRFCVWQMLLEGSNNGVYVTEVQWVHSGKWDKLTKYCLLHLERGPGSVVVLATGYGQDGPGIESRWRRDFRTGPDRPWGPSSLLYSGYRVFPRGKERPGRDADPPTPF